MLHICLYAVIWWTALGSRSTFSPEKVFYLWSCEQWRKEKEHDRVPFIWSTSVIEMLQQIKLHFSRMILWAKSDIKYAEFKRNTFKWVIVYLHVKSGTYSTECFNTIIPIQHLLTTCTFFCWITHSAVFLHKVYTKVSFNWGIKFNCHLHSWTVCKLHCNGYSCIQS